METMKMMESGTLAIEKALTEEMRTSLRVIFEHSEENIIIEKEDSSENQNSNDEEIFNKVVELFDGEIVR